MILKRFASIQRSQTCGKRYLRMSQKWVSTNGMANLCFPNKWFHWLSDPSTAPASESDGDELETIMTVGVYPDPSNSNQNLGDHLPGFTTSPDFGSQSPACFPSYDSRSTPRPVALPSPSPFLRGMQSPLSCRRDENADAVPAGEPWNWPFWWWINGESSPILAWQIWFPQTPAPKKTSTWLRLKIQKQSQQIPGFMFQFSLFTSPFSEVYILYI